MKEAFIQFEKSIGNKLRTSVKKFEFPPPPPTFSFSQLEAIAYVTDPEPKILHFEIL